MRRWVAARARAGPTWESERISSVARALQGARRKGRAGRWQMERLLGAGLSSDAPGAGRSGAEAPPPSPLLAAHAAVDQADNNGCTPPPFRPPPHRGRRVLRPLPHAKMHTARPDRTAALSGLLVQKQSLCRRRVTVLKYIVKYRKGPRKGPSARGLAPHAYRRDGPRQGLGLLCQVRHHHLCLCKQVRGED